MMNLKEGEAIEVGRSNVADLPLWDSFVSKRHAQILFKNGDYFLRDLQSEFGTFVQLSKSMEVDYPIDFEVGTTFFEMRME
jgi:pSer/pThr/pTyr-binding forkhead associated (FHA) protein